MNKLLLKLIVIFSLAFATHAQATLITSDVNYIAEDNYITYQNLDWAWASIVNVEFWGNNQLFAPETHAGWRYATEAEMSLFKANLSLIDFTRTDAQGNVFYVQAVEYWNSEFTLFTDPNFTANINAGQVASVWQKQRYDRGDFFDTFYVRDVLQLRASPASVPEPSTLAILALALISLSLRNALINKSSR